MPRMYVVEYILTAAHSMHSAVQHTMCAAGNVLEEEIRVLVV